MPGRWRCCPWRTSISSRHEERFTINILDDKDGRICPDYRLKERHRLSLALVTEVIGKSRNGDFDRCVGGHEHASRHHESKHLFSHFLLVPAPAELHRWLDLLIDHYLPFSLRLRRQSQDRLFFGRTRLAQKPVKYEQRLARGLRGIIWSMWDSVRIDMKLPRLPPQHIN